MGLNDRDYGHSNYEGSYGYGRQPGVHLGSPQSVTIRLIIFTAVVYVLQLMFKSDGFNFSYWFEMHAYWFKEPWLFYKLLTSGFLHSTIDFKHIIFNMVVLWFFGRTVEESYGRREYLVFYLTAIVFSSLAWNLSAIIEFGLNDPRFGPLGPAALGASGGLSAVLMLFALKNPNATVLLFFVLPIKAWVAGLLWVAMDVFGALSNTPGDNIGYGAHLGGFLFGYLYYKSNIRLTDYVPTDFNFKLPSFKSKPNLRVHRPTEDDEDATEQRLNELLDKVKEVGQDNLSKSEQRELQKLSKHYQRKRS